MSCFFPVEFFKGTLIGDLFLDAEPVWNALKLLPAYLEKHSSSGIDVELSDKVVLMNPESVAIAPGCKIEEGALIEGPCVIGAGCIVRFGAAVRAGTLMEPGSVVGSMCEIKRSILLKGAITSHFNYVGDSILGERVNLGAGVKFGNLRLDGKNVKVAGMQTGLRKFGGVLGDDCSIGCNCVINPGTLMGCKSVATPCSSIKGVWM